MAKAEDRKQRERRRRAARLLRQERAQEARRGDPDLAPSAAGGLPERARTLELLGRPGLPPPGRGVDAVVEDCLRTEAADLLEGLPTVPEEAAQALAELALESGEPLRAALLCRLALDRDPLCADALLLRSELLTEVPEEVVEGLRRAVEAGETSLAAELAEPPRDLRDSSPGVRSYRRVRLALALGLWDLGSWEEAVEHLAELLELDPDDGLGIRPRLVAAHLTLGQGLSARLLLDAAGGRDCPGSPWARVLERLLDRDPAGAREALAVARREAGEVEPYLTGAQDLPEGSTAELIPGEGAGGAAALLFEAWCTHPWAREWLAQEDAGAGAGTGSRRRGGRPKPMELGELDLSSEGLAGVPDGRRGGLEHCLAIARAASLAEAGELFTSGVPCRRRPRHRPCRGWLEIRRQEVPPEIAWRCPRCGDAGLIRGWRGTPADLSERLEPGEPILEAFLSTRELRALRRLGEHRGAEFCALLARARVQDAVVRLLAPADELQQTVRMVYELAWSSTGRRREDLEQACANLGVALLDHMGVAIDEVDPGTVGGLPREDDAGSPAAALRTEAAYRLEVTLRGAYPPIWRRIFLPGAITLEALHEVLQAVMGWTDCHLHLFEVGERVYSIPEYVEWMEVVDEREVRLCDLAPREGDRIVYHYDFGDDWRHDILVEEISAEPIDAPRCLGGRRACPPEDSGGVGGYAVLLDALKDAVHPRHEEYLRWLGQTDQEPYDPDEFDVAEVNRALLRLCGLWE